CDIIPNYVTLPIRRRPRAPRPQIGLEQNRPIGYSLPRPACVDRPPHLLSRGAESGVRKGAVSAARVLHLCQWFSTTRARSSRFMADIVIINPRFEVSFWGMEHALPFMGKRANLPVAALPLLAALTPGEHTVTLIDENVEALNFDRLVRADIVGLTGMSVQRF